MQKLQVELKNAPADASQVCCTANHRLNRDQSLSAQGMVLACNNPEENHSHHRGSSDLRVQNIVYVLNRRGEPLMPTTQQKANKLLKLKKAEVKKRLPFVIQLNYSTGESKQEIRLGVDSGYQNVGFSATTEKKELISGTLKLDSKTSKRLKEKLMYRKNRRNKLWYRKPRFLNRRKPEGWLPPSIQRRYDTHLTLIKRLERILPITKVVIETAKFDIQKIVNPDIEGKGYQQGSLMGYQNMKSYLLAREKGKCQLCKKDFIGQPVHIHHCYPRSGLGSDKPDNLAILHKKCHIDLHKKNLKLSKPKTYRPSIFMSIINKRFYNDVPNLEVTYGNITKVNRVNAGIQKTHTNDAFVISGGSKQARCAQWEIEQKRRNNRALQLNRKGFKPSIRRNRHKVQPKDLVKIGGFWVESQGTHCNGSRIMVNKKSISINKIKTVFNRGSMIWRTASPSLK